MGISRQAIYQLADRSPRFAEEMAQAKAEAIDSVEGRLHDAATAKGKDFNVIAAIFYLKNRASERWSDRHKVELTGMSLAELVAASFETAPSTSLTPPNGNGEGPHAPAQ